MAYEKREQHRAKERQSQQGKKLLRADREVFAEFGFKGATTRMIANRSGINIGLISRYFENKRGLLIAVMKNFSGGSFSSTEYPVQKTFQQECVKYAKRTFDAYMKNTAFYKIVLIHAIENTKLAGDLFKDKALVGDETIRRFAGYFQKANRKKIHDFILTIDNLLAEILVAHFILQIIQRSSAAQN